ncbi:dTDP-4-dehydrorhamnose 3,5-epimerase [uncultured Winogradskyella sp.]|uniref:dTDP-4-dehydrorhamnose 3,5-epimerase n=1 Tax=uncultured Winogradskyella sp. TaxID=395353 RepID=UPI0030DCC497|tara:strand:- start:153493 stop:154038 length:546 start_codon:yes stop_codon:yes gene_type:complete
MIITETKLKDCFIIEPTLHTDKRGYFTESFNQQNFNKYIGKTINFVQDNESMSSRGVLRGLHYQTNAHAQAKLVRVVKGEVLDIVVDLRKASKTFGQHISVRLNGDNKKQVFIPRGFAHGFLVLKDQTIFSYKCDNYYNKSSENGILYNDVTLNIDWLLPDDELILSDKDKTLQTFQDYLK